MQCPVVAAGRIIGASGVLQHAVLRGFRRQVQTAKRLRQHARCLGRHDAIDAPIQRPPDAAGDRHHIARGERLGRIVEPAEFGRQIAPKDVDLAIDPGNEGSHHCVRRLVERGSFAVSDLVDADGQMRDIAGNIGGPEDFRLAAERTATQPIHLPQPILGHGDAQPEIQVRRAGGVDMRDTRSVAQDFHAAAHGTRYLPCVLHDVRPLVQPIACTALGAISNVTRTSPGRDQGYLSWPRYFFAKESMWAPAPSSVTRVTLPRICR